MTQTCSASQQSDEWNQNQLGANPAAIGLAGNQAEQLAMTQVWVDSFIELYQQLDANNLALLESLYSADIHFQDPIHQIHGIDQLKAYFHGMYQNVLSIEFVIHDRCVTAQQASVYWHMRYRHPKLNGGDSICVDGSSHLKFNPDGQILFHRDYFDVGQMVYEPLPLLGVLIRKIKQRIGAGA